MDFLSYVAEVSRGWDEPNAREVGRMKSQLNAKGGMYVLNEDIGMKAKVAAMAKRMEELEMKKIQEVQAISETPVQAMPCSIFQSYEHLVEECPTIPAVREMFGDQANVIGQFKPNNNASYGNTYNSNWRTIQILLKTKAISVVGDFVEDQKSINAQLNQRIDSVESSRGRIFKGKEVKAVITLRSDKKVDLPTSKPKHDEESVVEKEKSGKIRKEKRESTNKDDHESSVDEDPEDSDQGDMMKKHMPPSFP
ncbi:hypothetical protein CK203_046731 [Vitis vinifera]|uniref:Uncharacterized protein n=1 Tax=Vitis vinifera TaxID=29760 RepID=A0A438H285_VITVI|nr:hypothetical protein CK203_046731 [Vitis vinifera]